MENIQVSITNLLTGTTLTFFSPPETIGDDILANFDGTPIRGRSSQYHGYDASGPRTTSLSVKIHEDYIYGTKNIIDFTNRLRALAYPEYDGYVVPPRCLVRIGDTLGGVCIINQVGVSWTLPIRNNRYICAEISIGLTILEPLSPSASDVEGGSWSASNSTSDIPQNTVTDYMKNPPTYPQTEWWKFGEDEAGIDSDISLKEKDEWWRDIY